ncbi:MAG: ATP-binding protein [Lachnospiraceae bacterium]|nr:ATP-binding protein [Lachnospiraceae bacterium]
MKVLKRKIADYIKEFYQENDNKILLIDGARQVGKTFIIREVCKAQYKNYIEINLLEDYESNKNFEYVKTTKDFYLQISAIYGNAINTNEDTIIFLDEIQVYPHLITMLKFLNQDNKYRYICSGSLLGVTLSNVASVPMGSVEIKKMYPLDFEEFLMANGFNTFEELYECFKEKRSLNKNIHNVLMDYFKDYLIIGGLPECVRTFLENRNIKQVRTLQMNITNFYINDATKYDIANKLETKLIYEYIPSLMENKKNRVVVKDIKGKKGYTFQYFEKSFEYLTSSGIAIKVNAISNPKFPLIESAKKSLLKLYLNDIGLLTNILYKENIAAIKNDANSINLGNVYETVVAEELNSKYDNLYYYDNKKNGEVDFLIDDYNNLSILPIEVKSGKDFTVHSAIDKFVKSKEYNVKKGIILSNDIEIKEEGSKIYMPIYYFMYL